MRKVASSPGCAGAGASLHRGWVGRGEGGARAEGTVERRPSTATLLRLRRRPARVEPGWRGGGVAWATHRRAMPRRRSAPSARRRAKLQESCPLPSASTCELILGGWRGRGGRGGGAGCSGLSRATWAKAPDVRAAPQAGQEARACRGTAAPLEVSGQLSGGTNPRSSGGSLGPRGGSGRRPSLRASLAVGISGSKALRNRLGGRPHNVKRSARKSLQLPRCRRFRGLNRQSTVSVLQSATVGLRHMCFTVVQFNRWPSAPHTRSHDTHTVHCYLKAVPSISSPP
jgi:hypothetical protein